MSKRILFISSQRLLRQMASTFLSHSEVELEILFANTVSESIRLLQEHEEIHYIYLGHKVSIDQGLKSLTKYLLPHINSNKTTIIGTNKSIINKDWAIYYHELTPIKSIMFQFLNNISGKKFKGSHLTFPLLSLLEFEKYPFNCFIKVKKGNKDSYLLIYNNSENVDFSSIYKYKDKGLASIHVEVSELLKSSEVLLAESKMQEEAELVSQESSKSFELSSEYATHILHQGGFTISPGIQELSTTIFEIAIEITKNLEGHQDSIKDLLNKTESFYFKHTSMSALIACYILEQLKLNDINMKEKLCFSAFFQNIFLETKKELLIDKNENALSLGKMDRERVLQHPQLASELLTNVPQMNSDIIKIVKEQHGHFAGTDFSSTIYSHLKLSLVFQIASYYSAIFLSEYEDSGTVNTTGIYNSIQARMENKNLSILQALKVISIKTSISDNEGPETLL